jgi:HK97 family phage prohead protease
MEQMINPLEKIEGLIKKGREFRQFLNFDIRAAGESGRELYVEGIACVFNKVTVLFEYDGVEYKEQVDAGAFATADMTDVIFNYNHVGKVMARTRNKTLQLSVENDGLHMRARLDGTEAGRQLYEEIRGGYIDRMSYAYTVKEHSYDQSNRLRTIKSIKKLYDVSAVDFPAYDSTQIYTRSLLDLDRAEREKAAAEIERRKRALLLLEL